MKRPIITIILTALTFWSGSATAEHDAKVEDKQVIEITPVEFWKLLKEQWDLNDKPIYIDLSTAEEHTKGRLTGARRFDFPADDFEAKVAKLDRNQVYLVYCQSGKNSAKSLAIFKRLKFRKLYYLKGGWRAYNAHIGNRGG